MTDSTKLYASDYCLLSSFIIFSPYLVEDGFTTV